MKIKQIIGNTMLTWSRGHYAPIKNFPPGKARLQMKKLNICPLPSCGKLTEGAFCNSAHYMEYKRQQHHKGASDKIATTTEENNNERTTPDKIAIITEEDNGYFEGVLVAYNGRDTEDAGLNLFQWLEKTLILEALKSFHWQQAKAAEMLGYNRVTFHHRIRRFGITHDSWRIHRPDSGASILTIK
jgi:DNA-binding protein Fis